MFAIRNGLRSLERPMMNRFYCSKLTPTAKEEIQELLKADKVVLFMKGTPDEPMCGFSKAACKVLEVHDVPFSSFNVLDDPSLRQGIKDYSDWPTIPQLYINSEFLGGCDILIKLHQSGDLVKTLKDNGITSKFEKPSD